MEFRRVLFRSVREFCSRWGKVRTERPDPPTAATYLTNDLANPVAFGQSQQIVLLFAISVCPEVGGFVARETKISLITALLLTVHSCGSVAPGTGEAAGARTVSQIRSLPDRRSLVPVRKTAGTGPPH